MANLYPDKTLKSKSEHLFYAGLTEDGTKVVTTSLDGFAYVHYTRGSERANLIYNHHSEASHGAATYGAALSSDGSLAVTAGADGAVRVWCAATGRTVAKLCRPNARYAAGVALTPDGETLFASFILNGGEPGAALPAEYVLYDLESGKASVAADWGAPVIRMPPRASPAPVADPTAAPAAELISFRALSGARVPGVALSADGTVLAYTAGGEARVASARDGALLASWAAGADAQVTLDLGGDVVAVADARGLRAGRVAGPGGLLAMRGYEPALTPFAALSGDGRFVVAPVRGRAFRVWSALSGEPVATLAGARDEVRAAAVSARGDVVVGCAYDGAARVWRVPAGRAAKPGQDACAWLTAHDRIALRARFWRRAAAGGRGHLVRKEAREEIRAVAAQAEELEDRDIDEGLMQSFGGAQARSLAPDHVDEEAFANCFLHSQRVAADKKHAKEIGRIRALFSKAAGPSGEMSVPAAAKLLHGETGKGEKACTRAVEAFSNGMTVDCEEFRAAAEAMS